MFNGKEHGSRNGLSKPGFFQPRRWRDAAVQSALRDEPSSNPLDAAPISAVNAAQRDLMRCVAEFMVRHQLPVTAANLALVCNGLSGSDAGLLRALTQRELSSGKIDQAWLDTLRAGAPDAIEELQKRANQMEDMMDLMDKAMNKFHTHTQSARDATGVYRSALSKQLEGSVNVAASAGLQEQSEGLHEFKKLLDLSRTMLGQLKTIEAEMLRNQCETEQLRESLAKARKEAEVDHLTGLPNRRAFERNLKAEVELMKANGTPLALAFCDIDTFKQINDIHGHDAGDRVLKAIAKALSKTVDQGCFVARHGGEEFVLLFSDMDKDQAFESLNAAREKLARRRLMNRETGQPYGQITFSAGVAQVDQFEDPREALAAADEALYRAKEAGRNRIELA